MNDQPDKPREPWNTVDSVRKRPGMYVGDVEERGLIMYLLGPIHALWALGPTRLAFERDGDGFVVAADVALPIEETPRGTPVTFEEILSVETPNGFRYRSLGETVLNALSERLAVEVRNGRETQRLTFRRGVRESRETVAGSDGPETTLRFAPDGSIFKVTDVSRPVFKSYFRWLSFLHAGTRFSFSSGGETWDYHAPRGLLDLFDAVSAPYVLLHDPIRFAVEDGPLRVEAVLAYQNRCEGGPLCFINGGRAPKGGTHEQGVRDALDRIHLLWELPKTSRNWRNGIVGIVSIHYPDVVWEGCVRERVGNPELRAMVRDLVVRGASERLSERPDVAEALKRLGTFSTLEAWNW